MVHKIWNGSVNFGLVTIPVGLYSATETHTIGFNQYQRGTSDRVRYRKVNERTGQELGVDDIVKGRVVNGTLVTVEPEELDNIAPGRSQTIDISSFVDLDEIDPVYFQKTYWLVPTGPEHARPYGLLRRALAETNRAGIARFVLRGKEYLTALRADEEVLALDTLFFADEIRSQSDVVGEDIGTPAKGGKELRMATDLIHSMSGAWQPHAYTDTYAARVDKLLEDKSQGRTPETEQPPQEPTEADELTDALRRSTEQAHGRNEEPAATGSEEVSELSKAELEQRAKTLNIRGRSKLNRSELEKAITEARPHRDSARRRHTAS